MVKRIGSIKETIHNTETWIHLKSLRLNERTVRQRGTIELWLSFIRAHSLAHSTKLRLQETFTFFSKPINVMSNAMAFVLVTAFFSKIKRMKRGNSAHFPQYTWVFFRVLCVYVCVCLWLMLNTNAVIFVANVKKEYYCDWLEADFQSDSIVFEALRQRALSTLNEQFIERSSAWVCIHIHTHTPSLSCTLWSTTIQSIDRLLAVFF